MNGIVDWAVLLCMNTRSPNATPRSSLRISNGLLALGSAAVLSIYTAGNLRTREAASRFADEGAGRRRPPADVDANGVTPSAATDASFAALPATEISATAQGLASATAAAIGTPSVRTIAPTSGAGSKATVVAVSSVAPAVPTVTPSTTPALPSSALPSSVSDAPVASTTPSNAVTPVATATGVAQNPVAAPAPAVVVAPSPTPPAASTIPADSTSVPKPAAEGAKTVWRDGTFSGWGTSRHGDIEATVVIEGGRITGASISRCLTRYSCSLVAHLQKQVITRQSADVDYVSGATQSANAFYYAVLEALKAAK